MQKIQTKKIFLLTFAIISCICIYPLYATKKIRTFIHKEKDYGPTIIPHLVNTRDYIDGAIVARINWTTASNEDLPYEMLFLRIIHPNGTVDEKDIKLDIPQINYYPHPIRFLNYYIIRKDHILITYVETTNPNDTTTYEDWE
jgi:hypothetical protein